MNLAADCIQVFSGHPLVFFRKGQRELPFRLLRKCLSNPAAAAYRNPLREIGAFMEGHYESLQPWKDSEIYYPLDYMARYRDASYFPYLIELLRLFLGMKDIRKASGLPDGYYRLKNVQGEILEIQNGRLSERTRDVLWRIPGFRADIYLPKNGLFSDILDDRFYPPMEEGEDLRPLKKRLIRTLDHMKDFSPDIWEDFQETVWNVAFLTKSPHPKATSVTMYFKYFGGIFLNGFVQDEHGGVESLVHEYIHYCFWLWWELERPTGIPPESVSIVSPMTGNKVPANAMIHALVIYVCALQYYRFVQSVKRPDNPALARRVNRRASQLSCNMPSLYRRLKKTVGRKTDMGGLLEYVMEVYRDIAFE